MRPQKYPVTLTSEDKRELEGVVKRGKHSRREIQRARRAKQMWKSQDFWV